MNSFGSQERAGLLLRPPSQIAGEPVECVWELRLTPDDFPFLLDHCVRGVPIMPGSMYIELAVDCFFFVFPGQGGQICLRDVAFPHALAIEPSTGINLKLKLEAKEHGEHLFTCEVADSTTLCASLTITAQERDAGSLEGELIPPTTPKEASAAAFYAELHDNGNEYGPAIRAITGLYREPRHAWADLTVPGNPSDQRKFNMHPVLLDGGIQALAAASHVQDLTYVLTGIERVEVFGALSGSGYSVRTMVEERPGPDDRTAVGGITIYDGAENVLVELSGVGLRYLEPAAPRPVAEQASKTPIVISASFTAEPVEDSLSFWGDELGAPFDLRFAPYNQIFQQLLDPASLLRQNRDGANVILLRFQDWNQGGGSLTLEADQAHLDRSFASHGRRVLPNQLEVAHLNQYETDYLYKEIFVDRSYLRHGIELNDGDCVIDIGANIGLFTLFAQNECRNTTVYAFEPSPPIFQLLKANAQAYGSDVHVFDCGISDATKEAEFTFYEKSSVFSSFSADVAEDEVAVRVVVQNILRESGITEEEELNKAIDELMAGRMDSKSFTCRLKSLSDVIKEQGIEKIDLLKVDAEKSELAILCGIDDGDWSKIRQIVLEVHDRDGAVIKSVEKLLESRGFSLTLEEEPLLHNSGLFTIYGRRQEAAGKELAGNATAAHTERVKATTLEFASALRSASAGASVPFVVVSCPPTPNPSAGNPDDTSAAMEELLFKELGDAGNLHLVPARELLSVYPVDDFFDPHGDRLGHVPYTPEFYSGLGTFIARKLEAVRRKPYKVIALDCDNTLWCGVCGEDEPGSLDIEGGWRQLQEFMVAQQQQGMLLCLCSKNAEEDVFRVFEERPEMPLQRDNFVEHRINWASKSENLVSLASSLSLGLDSFIFIDDNAVECAEVRAHCPDVLTLQLPDDPAQIPSYLEHVWAFDKAKITAEDKARTGLYRQNMQRDRFRTDSSSLKDFIAGLNLDVRISQPNESQLTRVAQLTQRTNQFNITTIRRSEAEIRTLLKDGAMSCLVVEVSDRFGDYGLVGVVLYETGPDSLNVDTFLLSCRVLGRGVEHKIIAELGEAALKHGYTTVSVPFVSTAKNTPALDFLRAVAAAFENDGGERKIFALPTDAARAVTYDPDAMSSVVDGADGSGATPAGATSGERGAAPIDYGRIAEAYRTPEDILRALKTRRIRDSESLPEGYVKPANDRERSISRIWEEVLGIGKVGVEHSFKELGGDSLKSVMLVAQLRKALSVDLAVTDLFEYPTVRAMAKMLDAADGPSTGSKKDYAGQHRGSRMRQRRMARRRGGQN